VNAVGSAKLRRRTIYRRISMKRSIKNLAEMIRRSDPGASIAFELWDGETLSTDYAPNVTLRFESEEIAKDFLARKWLAFGEAYTAGEIEVSGDLREALRLGMAVNFDEAKPTLQEKLELLHAYLKTRNTRHHAVKNISYHYDRGDDLYALYLDKTMAYSCAYFRNGGDSLDQAQLNKYEHTCRKLMLKPGERLVDIGCGWGGMLIYAAQNYGIRGTGCTISRNQYEYANRRIKELGLQQQIEVVLEDYRNIKEKFDKFVSIGMFEHVGKEFIPQFMQKSRRLLSDGGLGLLHTIGKDAESPGDPWILTYIFPGSYIPHLAEIVACMGKTGFSILDVENLRMHYALTLEKWAENFENNVDKVRQMYDETFVRMWRLYLNACSVGFKYGETRVYQILFSNGLNNELPATRDHCYKPYP